MLVCTRHGVVGSASVGRSMGRDEEGGGAYFLCFGDTKVLVDST